MSGPERATELDTDDCLQLLAGHHFGRVAVDDGQGPVVLPVNYVLDRGVVVFRTDEGTKLEAAREDARACFQVDHVDEASRSGWSVLVRGRIREVTDQRDLEQLRRLPLEPFVGGERDRYVRVDPAAVTGRVIPVPPGVPRGWFQAPDLGHIWKDADAGDLGL